MKDLKRRVIKWMSSIDCVYILCIRLLVERCNTCYPLQPRHLIAMGWVEENGFYFEPNVKSRDRISIQFENHYYRVWHGTDMTFIALKSSLDWFYMYYLLVGSNQKIEPHD